MDSKEPLITELLSVKPAPGVLEWIGLRSERRREVDEVNEATVVMDQGLEGDHFKARSGKSGAKRQVTLIQAEHLEAVASFLGRDKIEPGLVRRNLLVRGVNLYPLRNQRFRLGDEVILEGTGLCHPCSLMEEVLGPGGYNAMRGHGGLTARVIQAGTIRIGDQLIRIDED